jgi:4-amino-4-deoxy-L-arabinose transferase-like glycosyltransferase
MEHLERFATNKVGHPEGPLFYVPVLAVGLLPWTLLAGVLSSTRRGRSAWRKLRGAETRFLIVWLLVVVIFFSIASSKLAGYVLPAIPPAMLVLGAWIDRLDSESTLDTIAAVRGTAVFVLLLGATLVVAGIALPLLSGALPRDLVPPSDARQHVRIVFLLGGLAAIAGGASCARRDYVTTCGLAGTVLSLSVTLALMLLPLTTARSMVKTSRHLAAAIAREAQSDDLVVQYRTLMQGLLFYLGERIVQVDDCGEISRGAERAADRSEYFWEGTERLEREWGSRRGVFIVTSRRYEGELRSKLVPAPRIVAEDGEEVVLGNRPSARSIGRSASPSAGARTREGAPEGPPRHA